MSKYSDIDLEKISYLIEVEGYNNNQLIEYLGISKQTFYRWKSEKSDFRDTLKKSKVKLVAQIKNSLVKKTRGFFVTEWKEIIVDGQIVKVENHRYIPPSDTAIIFALANLASKNFSRQDKEIVKEKKHTEISNAKSDDEILKMLELNE